MYMYVCIYMTEPLILTIKLVTQTFAGYMYMYIYMYMQNVKEYIKLGLHAD